MARTKQKKPAGAAAYIVAAFIGGIPGALAGIILAMNAGQGTSTTMEDFYAWACCGGPILGFAFGAAIGDLVIWLVDTRLKH